MDELMIPETLAIARQNARTYAEIILVRAKAQTLADMARNLKALRDYVNPFMVERLRCERDAGKMLLQMEKNKGTVLGGKSHQPPGNEPTYEQLGIRKWEAAQQQIIARIPESIFEDWLADCVIQSIDITIIGAVNLGRAYNPAAADSEDNPDDPHYRAVKRPCCAMCRHLVCDRRINRDFMMCSLHPAIRYYEPANEHGTNEDSWLHICDRFESEE